MEASIEMSNLAKLLSRSAMLVNQGDLAGARTELEKAVRDHGRKADPWISLAAVHGMGGHYQEALQCARRAVELAPNSLQGWINLAGAARATDNFLVAAEALQRACELPGCPPQSLLDLGLILARLGRWAEAVKPLKAHLARQPGDRDATVMLATAMSRNGESDAALALIKAHCERHPADVGALCQLARSYAESGQAAEAARICDQALRDSPEDTDVLILKADLLEFDDRLSEATDVLERIDRKTPGDPRILARLSKVYWVQGKPEVAIAYARAALKLSPHHVPTILLLSSEVLTRDTGEARQLLEHAEAIAPADPAVRVLKGRLLEFEGDKQGAWECVRAAIESGSVDLHAATVAAGVAPAIGKIDEAIALLERLANRPGIAITEHRSLRFALTRLCDKAKQYDNAFKHAAIANRLKNAVYDDSTRKTQIERLKVVYSVDAVATLPRSRNRSELPVFIVGMPRSGTSLMEQILSCHSKVHARGETTDVKKLIESIPYYPDAVRDLPVEKLDAMAEAYIERLRMLDSGALRVTDKLPGNYMFLGPISQLFPAARIINCRRDPRDICLSNYTIEFIAGHAYAYDLESLAHAYENYRNLMEHWKAVLALPILDVRYEDLIADPRAWVAKVLEFCGLDWEDACLDFHKSDRQVVTASYDQVRTPLYTTSVARWKHYERHLEPVSRILGLTGDTYL